VGVGEADGAGVLPGGRVGPPVSPTQSPPQVGSVALQIGSYPGGVTLLQ
jgi:hypothetical protein